MVKNPKKKSVVVGIGSALMDILIHEDDDFITKTGAAKGGMTLVDQPFIESTIEMSSGDTAVVPGGSACNTTIGIGKLGGNVRFVGKYGRDDLGAVFEKDLKKSGVQPNLFQSESPTGRVLSIITPDAQRSMFTYLGASSEMTPQEVSGCNYSDVAIVHVEGYLLFDKDLVYAALESAKAAGAKVSLDLASFTVVEQSLDILNDIVDRFVDILIANEDEAYAFTGHRDEAKAIASLSKRAEIAVLKIGKRGSYIAQRGKMIKVEPAVSAGDVVDTTGAGDLWAAGLLFGIVNGYPIEKSGKLASLCGYEVCRVVGASIPEKGWERIRRLV